MHNPALHIVEGPLRGKRITFSGHETFIFGRDPTCHVSLEGDDFISRFHFMVEINAPHARLRDLGSLNGTRVNGRTLGGARPDPLVQGAASSDPREVWLQHGDCIQAGKSLFKLYMPASSSTRAVADATQVMEKLPFETPESRTTECVIPPVIEEYEVESELGRGGMGVVYLARRRADHSLVALKVVIPRISVNAAMNRILEREIQVLRNLRHRHIVGLLDSFCRNGSHVLVMEYCAGGGLDKRLGAGARGMAYAESVPIMLDVLEGLAYAHGQEYVHRDIKPANILLSKGMGRSDARIADFGLAKSFEQAGLSGMTVTGAFAGTLEYMPREQLTDYKYVRPVSDVWSAAATFYELLCGHRPREIKANEDGVQRVLRNAIVPLRSRKCEAPQEVQLVIDKALQNSPEERYPSGAEFFDAMKRAIRAAGTSDAAPMSR